MYDSKHSNIQKGGLMTSNQIAYWNLQESKRHNVMSENETQRHNVVTENETGRHNWVTEQISISNLNESVRHNKATEYETNRHNVATEQLGSRTQTEVERHNRVTEAQGDRDLNIREGTLAESVRHNKVNEAYNLSNLQETTRHNVSTEKENVRHNTSTESLTGRQLTENERHNLRQEALAKSQLKNEIKKTNETIRHNKVSEGISAESNDIIRARNVADKQIREAEVAIKQWEQADKSKLNQARVREVNQSISKMQQDIKTAQLQNRVAMWNAANNSASAVARIIDALIPL